jgi:hypothetical protein
MLIVFPGVPQSYTLYPIVGKKNININHKEHEEFFTKATKKNHLIFECLCVVLRVTSW